MEQVYFSHWLERISDANYILSKIQTVDPKDLYVKFRKSATISPELLR